MPLPIVALRDLGSITAAVGEPRRVASNQRTRERVRARKRPAVRVAAGLDEEVTNPLADTHCLPHTNTPLVLAFPCVCPEPVLAKRLFQIQEWCPNKQGVLFFAPVWSAGS
jgi:hypothetical protein